tara:strand:+ start:3925 stop:4272 length:348 start_codon:yes stop_codon:yes gene_type:complete
MSFDIKIEGIKTKGKHGVYDFEKVEDQLFLIDLHMTLNSNTVKEDSIETTIDYAKYVEKVEELVLSSSFNLIETLAEHLYKNLDDSKIKTLAVTVHKPNTALSVKTQDISVTYSG